jgi:hypothetical protein
MAASCGRRRKKNCARVEKRLAIEGTDSPCPFLDPERKAKVNQSAISCKQVFNPAICMAFISNPADRFKNYFHFSYGCE